MENYQKYLHLRFQLIRIGSKYDLGHAEEALIDYVAFLNERNQTPTIKTILMAKELGSQATLHARLHSLVDRQFLNLDVSSDDGRIKYISLGKKGVARAKEIGRLLSGL